MAIEKETNVSKSESNYVKNCASSGRIIMLQQILELPSLPIGNIQRILRVLFEILLHNKHFEETVLFVLDKFFNKIYNDFYVELNFNNKKNLANVQKNFNKTLGIIFETMEKYITGNKNQIEDLNKLYEFSLYFLVAKMYLKSKGQSNKINSLENKENESKEIKDKIVLGQIEAYYGPSFLNKLIDEGTVLGFFKLIVKTYAPSDSENKGNNNKNKKNQKNLDESKSLSNSLDLLFDVLKLNKDREKVYKIWNLIIEEKTNQILTEISPKNFQYLIFYVSRFVLKSFFHLDYVKQIFDSSFFISFLRFKIKQKFKFLGNLIEIVTENIEKIINKKSSGDLKIAEYCFDLLTIFGNEPESYLSIQTFKSFHAVRGFFFLSNFF